ncbi:serine/threonine-protein kinase [Paractinoplanes rishiriensis]|uniref:serine/threonine-protein kinase n=1 Tax=Paractinoplanes rishiriensis TaxID=1050105 RepID=UPI001EF1D2B9|nr:serine/threonine-protein kinase [Actinoplanes rishiriensis]
MVPQQIGSYRIVRLLGAGSFATVWLGHDPALGADVAIKVLADNWSHDLRVRERFQQEARLLWRLSDERLVRVHAVGELADGRPYSVMEFASGGSLRDRIAQGGVPPAEGLRLLREIAAGVAVLHRNRIVHRDLTPGNIVFDGDRVLIADLGLAKALAAASGLTARAGTPGYMAPEQDDPLATVSTTADVYGLGKLGQRLGVPPKIAPVLQRATAPDPADRYPDASAFAEALDRAARSGGALTWGQRAVGVVAVLVVLAGVTSDMIQPEEIHQAFDGTGQITVTLPTGWKGAGSGWAGRFDVDGHREPALVVSPDPGRWHTDPDVPGAFVGLSRSAAARTTAAGFVAERPHASCTASPLRQTRQAGLDWVVAGFTCATGKPVLFEAAAVTAGVLVYAQIAPGDQDVDALLARIEVANEPPR